jgi:hypothetical protein
MVLLILKPIRKIADSITDHPATRAAMGIRTATAIIPITLTNGDTAFLTLSVDSDLEALPE